jgi:hypothetical protein
MWVVNNQKAQAQTFLRYDIQNILTQLNNEEGKIDGMVYSLNRAIGGLPSGQNNRMLDRCQETKRSLETVRRLLATCNESISQLQVREWVPDD